MKKTFVATSVSAVVVWLLPSVAPGDIVGFQGESGITPPNKPAYRIQDDPAALGGQYIDSDHRAKNGGSQSVWREYSVSLPAGTYDLWARIYTPSAFDYDPDPANNDEPDEDGTPAFVNDSFFAPESFGGDPTLRLNGYASAGRFDGSGNPERANVHDEYAWVNMTDGVDLNGLEPSSGTVDLAPSYTSKGGAEIFTIKCREAGIRHDAFAFVTDGLEPTEEELDAAVETPPGGFRIVSISVDPANFDVTLTWTSQSNAAYGLEWSSDPAAGGWIEIDDNIEGEGDTTTFIVPAGPAADPNPAVEPRMFFRVRKP